MFDRKIESIANKLMYKESVNHMLLLDNFGDKVIAQVNLAIVPDEFRDTALKDAGLKEKYNILLMLVQRNGEEATAVDGMTVLFDGDILVVIGELERINEAFLLRSADLPSRENDSQDA